MTSITMLILRRRVQEALVLLSEARNLADAEGAGAEIILADEAIKAVRALREAVRAHEQLGGGGNAA